MNALGLQLARRHPKRAAFTLMEVMVTVLIVMMLSISIYRFLSANLEGIATVTQTSAEQERMSALFRYVQTELNDLPPRGQGLLLGSALKLRDFSSDEMQWLCRPGSGILTTGAVGEFRTTLMLRPRPDEPKISDLGLRRRPVDGSDKDVNWVPLIEDVAAMEIRYFQAQLNSYIDRWTDQNSRPLLVRISIWKTRESPPQTAVLTIAASQLQQ